MKLTGAQIFLESLRKEQVEVIFGLPGGVNLPEFDVLFDEKQIDLILARHEQGAGHMAEGYAKATGKVGVCLVTSGPGATNVITAVADAYMDSVPVVFFTGQVSTSLIGNDAFQEADVVGISRPCTKYNYLVKNVEDLAQTIKEAFYIAGTGRPGPVLVDLPKDVVLAKTEFKYPEKVYIRGYNPTLTGNKWQIRQAAEAISKSKRAVIYIGGGAVFSDASAEILELAEITGIPVTVTLMGLGAFPSDHPLSLGMLGMHGGYWTNMAMHEAELIIALGARFDDRVTGKTSEFAPHATIIHVDIDPTSIRKNVETHIPIVGDVKTVLRELNPLLRAGGNGNLKEMRKPWVEQIAQWKRDHPFTYRNDGPLPKPQYVIEKIYELMSPEGIIVTDVGQHQMWAAQYYNLGRPRTFLTSGGLGTMGFGLPAAIGAQKAFPKRQVVCIAGDGSFQMNLQELATAKNHGLPVKVVIINNKFHGMVRQWQQLFYNGRYSGSYLGDLPDYVKLAEAYTLRGFKTNKTQEVERVLREGFATDGPVLIDMQVDPTENCYPMIPAGGAHHQMLFEDPAPQPSGAKKEESKESISMA